MASLAANHFLSFAGSSDEEEIKTCRKHDSVSSPEHPQVFRRFSEEKTVSQQLPRHPGIGENASGKMSVDKDSGHVSGQVSSHVSGRDQGTGKISRENPDEAGLGIFNSNHAVSQFISDQVKLRPVESVGLCSKNDASLASDRDVARNGEESEEMGELFRAEMARLAKKQRATKEYAQQSNFLLASLETGEESGQLTFLPFIFF